MKAKKLLSKIASKSRLKSERKLANYLGITQQTLITWKNKNELIDEEKITTIIKKTRAAAVKSSQGDSIKPIVEFFPVKPVATNQGKSYKIFNFGKEAKIYAKELKTKLERAHGIYIFHDSSGRALYAGKALEMNLWAEINNALNRARDTQLVYRVKHPKQNRHFKAGNEKNRQPTLYNVRLHDMAAYFSAYEVVEGMISHLEALIVRGFANDLLNARMETFKTKRKKKRGNK